MQFRIANQLQEIGGEVKTIQVTTVILSHDYNDPNGVNMYSYHCHRCGHIMLQYKGFVAKVLPGLTPIKLPKIIMCTNTRCKQRYCFETIV